MMGNFSGVNSKGLYLRSEKEKENCCLVFTSPIKRETRRFYVVVVQQRQRNGQKKRSIFDCDPGNTRDQFMQ